MLLVKEDSQLSMHTNMTLLVHIEGSKKLNLSFYLLKSLTKMDTRVQNHPEHSSHSFFRHGLVKLLILEDLKKQGRNWSQFIF